MGFACTIPFLFFSCKKNSDAPLPVPDANEQQVFIRQKVNKHVFDNTTTLDTFRYEYNPKGQLTHMNRSWQNRIPV